MKLEFSQQLFEKYSKYKILWKSVQREPNFSMRTDRHDEANNRFSHFANAPQNVHRFSYKVSVIHVRFLMKPEFYVQISTKSSNVLLQKNPSSGSWVVPCGKTDRQTDGRTHMTKLIVPFRSTANPPNMFHTLPTPTHLSVCMDLRTSSDYHPIEH